MMSKRSAENTVLHWTPEIVAQVVQPALYYLFHSYTDFVHWHATCKTLYADVARDPYGEYVQIFVQLAHSRAASLFCATRHAEWAYAMRIYEAVMIMCGAAQRVHTLLAKEMAELGSAPSPALFLERDSFLLLPDLTAFKIHDGVAHPARWIELLSVFCRYIQSHYGWRTACVHPQKGAIALNVDMVTQLSKCALCIEMPLRVQQGPYMRIVSLTREKRVPHSVQK